MKWWMVCVASLFCFNAFARPDDIRVVPLQPTPEPTHVQLTPIFPKSKAVVHRLPAPFQFRIEGFPLGTKSQFDRAQEVFNSPNGQSVHVFIDDNFYMAYSRSVMDSFDENREFNDKIVRFSVKELSDGEHVIRAFPVRSFKESLKGRGCYFARVFYYKSTASKNPFDINAPCLTYNQPQGIYYQNANSPLLLDFYIMNCRLSSDGYRVRLFIDGQFQEALDRWTPYLIYGLSKGSHTISLQLVDSHGRQVPGLFNHTTRTIIIN